MQVDFPGGHAIFREKINVRQRRELQKAALGAAPVASRVRAEQGDDDENAVINIAISPDEFDSLEALRDTGILMLLESWTLDQPLPQTPEDLWELDSEVYDALSVAASKLQATVMGAVDTQYSPDPKAPTSGSTS